MGFTVEVRPQTFPEDWLGMCRVPTCGFVVNEHAHHIEHATYAAARLYAGRIIDHATDHGWRVDDDRDSLHPYHLSASVPSALRQCTDHLDGCGWMVEEADGEVLYEIEIYG